MAKPPLHRRLRISLRGLLLLLTVFCIWASIHGKWIRDRQEARDWIVQHEVEGGWAAARPEDVRIGTRFSGRQTWISAAEKELAIPWSLKILGERPLYFIFLDKGKLSPQDAARIDSLQGLFPEAEGVHIEESRWTQRWPPKDVAGYFANPIPGPQNAQRAPLTAPHIPVN